MLNTCRCGSQLKVTHHLYSNCKGCGAYVSIGGKNFVSKRLGQLLGTKITRRYLSFRTSDFSPVTTRKSKKRLKNCRIFLEAKQRGSFEFDVAPVPKIQDGNSYTASSHAALRQTSIRISPQQQFNTYGTNMFHSRCKILRKR